MQDDFSRTIEERIKPILDHNMKRFLGVSIKEISDDISDKLKKSTLYEAYVNTSIPFKKSKKLFKKQFLSKLLHMYSISDVSRIAKVSRRSVHRMIKELNIRSARAKPMVYEYASFVKAMIDRSASSFKDVIREDKLKEVYKGSELLSKDIIKEIPDILHSLKEAEREFEKAYLRKALSENQGNITRTARKIGIRFETLLRKMRRIGIR